MGWFYQLKTGSYSDDFKCAAGFVVVWAIAQVVLQRSQLEIVVAVDILGPALHLHSINRQCLAGAHD